MTRPARTERHLALAWTDQVDAARRAAQSALPWRGIASAIEQQLQHGAAALSDPGTESVLEQVLAAPTRHHTGYSPHQEPPMSDGHHVPAALTQPGDLPAPIPFPARPANARAASPSQATLDRWERQHRQLLAAEAKGKAEGLQLGDKQGWRRGVVTGTILAAVITSLAWSAYLSIAAPEVAPPSAQRPTVL